MSYPSGIRHIIINCATPIDDARIQLVQLFYRNDTEEHCPTQALIDWDAAVVYEDRDILEADRSRRRFGPGTSDRGTHDVRPTRADHAASFAGTAEAAQRAGSHAQLCDGVIAAQPKRADPFSLRHADEEHPRAKAGFGIHDLTWNVRHSRGCRPRLSARALFAGMMVCNGSATPCCDPNQAHRMPTWPCPVSLCPARRLLAAPRAGSGRVLDRRPLPVDAEGLACWICGSPTAASPPSPRPVPAPKASGVDLDRGQVWPCFVDGHVHLDKTQTWPRQTNPDGTHSGARAAVIADRAAHYSEADIEPRFEFGLRCAYAHGTAAMRTHLDSYWPAAKAHWAVFRRMRDAWTGRIDLQAVSITTLERFAGDDGVALANEVARCRRHPGHDHHRRRRPGRIARNSRHCSTGFSRLAEERGLAIDLHLDETGDANSRTLDAVARTAMRRGFRAPIQVGHVCSLSMQTDQRRWPPIALCADAGLW